jgi:hypothetical protein
LSNRLGSELYRLGPEPTELYNKLGSEPYIQLGSEPYIQLGWELYN